MVILKKIVLYFLVLFVYFGLLYSCRLQNESKKSDVFLTGEFRYKEKPFDKTFVIRDSLYQIEYDSERKIMYKLKIDWLNRNEYNLTLLSSSDSIQRINIGQVLKVKIIKRYKRHYSCFAMINGNSLNLTMVNVK